LFTVERYVHCPGWPEGGRRHIRTYDLRILHDHIGGRVPLIAAGQIRTAEQAEWVIDEGLELVALGQGLVMSPDWVAHAREGSGSDIKLSVSLQDVSSLTIPQKLWAAIEGTAGWFDMDRSRSSRTPNNLSRNHIFADLRPVHSR